MKKWVKTVLGLLIFFLTVAFSVSVSMLIFSYVNYKSQGDLTTIAIVMLLVIIFLTVLFSVIDAFRRKFTVSRPVEEILTATEKIASGDFSVRLVPLHKYNKFDDFDLIKENINILCEELGKSEMLKSDFISNVSHELKTPISVIQNYSKMLTLSSVSEEDKKNYVKVIVSASKNLSSLVGNILKLNKLENSVINEKQEVRLDELIAETLFSFEDKIENKNLQIITDIEEIQCQINAGYFETIVSNLISNAIKFTPENGTIKIKLNQEEKNVRFAVEDSGIGISAEDGKYIFDKFYQADKSHSGEGNGLGLALVKKVVANLGGEISAESTLGKGSVFTVVIKNVL